jgi:hypothetical protein
MSPPSINLTAEVGGLVLLESGKFIVNQITVGGRYHVHGELKCASEFTTSYYSPFGAYTGRACMGRN